MLGKSLFLFLFSVADVRLVSGIVGGLHVFGDKFSSFSNNYIGLVNIVTASNSSTSALASGSR